MAAPAVEFIPETHTYLVNGKRELSVTQHLEAGGISDFSGVPDDILWWAQQRGTMVHRACHYINQHNLDPESIDERISGYVGAWLKCRRDHNILTCLDKATGHPVSEHLIYRRITMTGADAVVPSKSDLVIIGQMDLAATMHKQGLIIADLKTGDPTDAWGPQLAGYTRGYGRTAQYTHKRVNVQLSANGSYRLHWHPIREFDKDWSIFRECLLESKRKEVAA